MWATGNFISLDRFVQVLRSGLVARQYENSLPGASQYRRHSPLCRSSEGPSPIRLTMLVPAPTIGGPSFESYGPCIFLLKTSRRFLPPSFSYISFLMTITQRSSALVDVPRPSWAISQRRRWRHPSVIRSASTALLVLQCLL